MLSAVRRNLVPTPIRLIIISIISFISCMIFFPTEVFQASKLGISAWWNIVFPALLPFFISSELLMSYGVVQFMGVLLEPIMRPLFRVPGAGSFVMTIGYTSGFPISASLTARLRKGGLCTRVEAERLICFTNNASPLFMLVAVGVGMFESPRLGVLIAICHYSANLLLGLLLRFYRTNDPEFISKTPSEKHLLTRAVLEMRRSVRSNHRPFGKILGDAISSSMNKLLVIGGFVIIFSVIIKIFSVMGIMTLVNNTVGFMVIPFNFSPEIIRSLGWGIFEITLGTRAASEAVVPLIQQVTAASMILGWGGLSVLAQVAAMTSESDIRLGVFIISRFFHATVAGFLTLFLMNCNSVRSWLAQPTWAETPVFTSFSWLAALWYFSKLCFLALIIWFIMGVIVCLWRSLSVVRLKI